MDDSRIKHIMKELEKWERKNQEKKELDDLELNSLKEIFFEKGENYEKKLY